jgi:uncharacterized protein YutE (UPF0331/DUF86 family)
MVDRDFLADHKAHIKSTLDVLYSKDLDADLNPHEQAGTATFIMNIYTGVENILRHILEDVKNVRVPKTSTWHKDILSLCVENGVITEELKDALSGFMRFRHYHVHGYGYMSDWNIVKTLALSARETTDRFFKELNEKGYWHGI